MENHKKFHAQTFLSIENKSRVRERVLKNFIPGSFLLCLWSDPIKYQVKDQDQRLKWDPYAQKCERKKSKRKDISKKLWDCDSRDDWDH